MTPKELSALRLEWQRAFRASADAAFVRYAMQPGTSRKRVTTANARWARHAEARDGLAKQIQKHGYWPCMHGLRAWLHCQACRARSLDGSEHVPTCRNSPINQDAVR